MAINEKKEGYIVGADKYVFSKDRYVFADCYGEQLRSKLEGALAFSIVSSNGFYDVITNTGETARVTIKKIGIKFSKSLLPEYCKPELIEEALATLHRRCSNPALIKEVLATSQITPDILNLLKVLGEYAKNDLFEQKMADYTTTLLGGLGFLFLFLSFLGTFPALPLILSIHILFVFVTVSLVASLASFAAFLVASGILGDDIRGLKFGRWVGDLIKGNNREPANIKELEKDLTLLINECKTKKIVEEVAKDQPKEGMEAEGFEISKKIASAASFQSIYPWEFFPKDSVSTDQGTVSNTYDSPREYRY